MKKFILSALLLVSMSSVVNAQSYNDYKKLMEKNDTFDSLTGVSVSVGYDVFSGGIDLQASYPLYNKFSVKLGLDTKSFDNKTTSFYSTKKLGEDLWGAKDVEGNGIYRVPRNYPYIHKAKFEHDDSISSNSYKFGVGYQINDYIELTGGYSFGGKYTENYHIHDPRSFFESYTPNNTGYSYFLGYSEKDDLYYRVIGSDRGSVVKSAKFMVEREMKGPYLGVNFNIPFNNRFSFYTNLDVTFIDKPKVSYDMEFFDVNVNYKLFKNDKDFPGTYIQVSRDSNGNTVSEQGISIYDERSQKTIKMAMQPVLEDFKEKIDMDTEVISLKMGIKYNF